MQISYKLIQKIITQYYRKCQLRDTKIGVGEVFYAEKYGT